MHLRYTVWAVKPRAGKPDKILLAGLGYQRQLAARWTELTGRGDRFIELRLWQLLKDCDIKPRFVRFVKIGQYETRTDARAVLLNLRMQNPNAVIEDWYDRLE